MARKKWRELSPTSRRVVIVAAGVEGALKTAALIDLARRRPDELRGAKTAWALAITFVNSAGIVPIAYFVRGRKR